MNAFAIKIVGICSAYAAIGAGAWLLWGLGGCLFSVGLSLLFDQILMGVLDVCDSRTNSK